MGVRERKKKSSNVVCLEEERKGSPEGKLRPSWKSEWELTG